MRNILSNKGLRLVSILIIFGVAIGLAGIVFLKNRDNRTTMSASDAQLKSQLGCGRSTADYRETDVFCDNVSLYRQLTQHGIAIDATTTSKTAKLVLVATTNKTPRLLSDAPVQLKIGETVECIKAPCPLRYHTVWSGTTDDLGVVEVPRDKLVDATVASGSLSAGVFNPSPVKAAYIITMSASGN